MQFNQSAVVNYLAVLLVWAGNYSYWSYIPNWYIRGKNDFLNTRVYAGQNLIVTIK